MSRSLHARGILVGVLLIASSQFALAQANFGFLLDFGACGCGAGWLGVTEYTTDGYDPDHDGYLVYFEAPGYVGVFHVEDGLDWEGPTAYYPYDRRASMGPAETKVWSPIHLWARSGHTSSMMSLGTLPSPTLPPPSDREYLLTLTYVPPTVNGAPPVGTRWEVPSKSAFLIEVPSFWTLGDGRSSYQIEFRVSAVTVRGDADCDGDVDFFDIDPFVAAFAGRDVWENSFEDEPPCGYRLACDVNRDGSVDFWDIDPFIACLGGQCPETAP